MTYLQVKRWQEGDPVEAPLSLYQSRVEPGWIDYNGHMTESSYLWAFGEASDALFRYVGIDEAYRAAGSSFYTVETHLNYYKEMKLDEPITVTTQLLGLDEKRLHLFHGMFHGATGELAATTEQMLVHVSIEAGVSQPIPSHVYGALQAILAAHRALAIPSQVGRQMGIKPKASAARGPTP